MKIGVISVYVDPSRRGEANRSALQMQVGPLVAALLPPTEDIDVVFDTWRDPAWDRDYDLLFITCLHSDFDRARQISHYWRRRGARTVFGGVFASTYPHLCRPFFDAVVIGDAEGAVGQVYRDFRDGCLQPVYVSSAYDAERVPVPRLDLAADQQVIPLSLEATRGCPFTCNFCALTAIGTRFHLRPPELVVRDVIEGQRMLRGLIPRYKIPAGCFVDNNIGGNPAHLARLCEALEPLRIRWGAAITFNCMRDPDLVKRLAAAGCRLLFMGLETFNPDALADMRKYQNALDDTRAVLDRCRRHGILVMSGLMTSPVADSCEYMATVADRLRECGLHVPTFLAIECPIPGTPSFQRLAERSSPAFLPNALLRDFTGYTLVVKPQRESTHDFIEGYKASIETVFTRGAKVRKLADDLPRLLAARRFESALVDLVHQITSARQTVDPDRTYIAGTDRPPPEHVPLTADDFDSEEEYRAVMEPMPVTDQDGRVLPQWLAVSPVYDRRGRLTPEVLQIAARAAMDHSGVAAL